MGMFRLMGLFTIIPATVLLTISFFVLFALRKTEAQGLKVFGYVIVALLWVGVLLLFSLGFYTLSTGRMICPMSEMMKGKTHWMMKGGQMSPMMQGRSDEPALKR